jgi:predicted nucleotidyltransferase
MTRDEIINKIEENKEVIRGFGARRVGLFGSYARGDQTDASDLDILVDFEHAGFDNYFDLKLFLEDLFGRKVDLVIARSIKPRIRDVILAETVYAQGL